MKLDFSKITGKVAVWCDTEEKAKEFINQIKENDLARNCWTDKDNKWGIYENKTCYEIGIYRSMFYSPIDFYKKEDYKIIPFNDLIIQDKPISDYTIGEWQECCNNTECFSNDSKNECKFYKMCEKVKTSNISRYDLSNKSKFTSDEIEKLKAIKVLYQNTDEIKKGENNEIRVIKHNLNWYATLHELDFPSLKQGETIKIDEVLKEYNI